MTACAGDVRTQIVVTEGTGRTGTFAFILRVQESALLDDTDTSDTELPDIIDMAERNAARAEDAADRADEAAEKADEAMIHYPIINETNHNWMVWDVDNEVYVDTGVKAEGTTRARIVGTALIV